MDKYDKYWIDSLVYKVKQRDNLVKRIHISKKEIESLQQGIAGMEYKIISIDAEITTLHKPKVVKNAETKCGIHDDS